MDAEKREKPKKKKIKKQTDEEEINGKTLEDKILEGTPSNSAGESRGEGQRIFSSERKELVTDILAENWSQSQGGLTETERSSPKDFYIAHPRNIKRTAHFKDVHSRKLSELLEAFHMFDFDRDGLINHDDLKKSFASLCIDVEKEEIDQMLSEGFCPLNFDAFVILLGCKTLDLDPEEVLLSALSTWDDHQEGLLSYERLMQHIMAWGDKFTEEEAAAALADAPIVLNKTKEKMIDYIQFSEDLCGLRKMMQKRTNEGENLLS